MDNVPVASNETETESWTNGSVRIWGTSLLKLDGSDTEMTMIEAS